MDHAHPVPQPQAKSRLQAKVGQGSLPRARRRRRIRGGCARSRRSVVDAEAARRSRRCDHGIRQRRAEAGDPADVPCGVRGRGRVRSVTATSRREHMDELRDGGGESTTGAIRVDQCGGQHLAGAEVDEALGALGRVAQARSRASARWQRVDELAAQRRRRERAVSPEKTREAAPRATRVSASAVGRADRGLHVRRGGRRPRRRARWRAGLLGGAAAAMSPSSGAAPRSRAGRGRCRWRRTAPCARRARGALRRALKQREQPPSGAASAGVVHQAAAQDDESSASVCAWSSARDGDRGRSPSGALRRR